MHISKTDFPCAHGLHPRKPIVRVYITIFFSRKTLSSAIYFYLKKNPKKTPPNICTMEKLTKHFWGSKGFSLLCVTFSFVETDAILALWVYVFTENTGHFLQSLWVCVSRDEFTMCRYRRMSSSYIRAIWRTFTTQWLIAWFAGFITGSLHFLLLIRVVNRHGLSWRFLDKFKFKYLYCLFPSSKS